MNWFARLSIRWKFQIGFFFVTMVTTIYNRLLAVHELQGMIDTAKAGGAADTILRQLEQNLSHYIFNSFWESGLEFVLQFFLIGFVANIFVRPIRDLCDALRHVEKGDLTKGVENKSQDEIGVLERCFNDMLEKLNRIMRQIDESGKRMAHSAHQIAAISNEISDASRQEQSRSQEVLASTQELNSISRNVEEQANLAATQAQALTQQAQVSIQAVERNISEMQSTATEVDVASSQISDLAAAAARINHIITVIQTIANQTNLLALNAAIEAARAGEAGRGFAVVADEVRKLAENTNTSASQVNNILGELTGKVDQVTLTMSNVVDKMQGSQQVAGETVSMIQTLANGVTETAQANMGISMWGNRQVAEFATLENRLQSLFATLENSGAKVETTAMISGSLHTVTNRLEEIMNEFQFEAGIIDQSQNEKRRHPRAERTLLVQVSQQGQRFEALCHNMSLTGMQLEMRDKLGDQSALQLDVRLPDGPAHNALSVAAKVMWERSSPQGGWLYGVQFTNVSPEVQSKVRKSFDYLGCAAEFNR